MNELETTRKNEILKVMSATQLTPLEAKNEIGVQMYSQIFALVRRFWRADHPNQKQPRGSGLFHGVENERF